MNPAYKLGSGSNEKQTITPEKSGLAMNGQITENINVVTRNPNSGFYHSRPRQEIEGKIRQLEESLIKGLYKGVDQI